jgi:hypothetical protein
MEAHNEDSSPESRGILQLANKPSWTPSVDNAIPNTIQPFVKGFADLSAQGLLAQNAPMLCSPCSVLLLPPGDSVLQTGYNRSTVFAADYTISSLFQQALGKNGTGSVAHAVSMLITTLSSMAYYDQMPQFERSAETKQTFFATVLYPQSHLGYWAVMVVLAVHLGLVCAIALGFGICSQHTFLGNHWQSIAQLLGPEADELLAKTRLSTDKEVKHALKEAGGDDINVCVRTLKDERGVGINVLRRRWDEDKGRV